MILKLSGNTNKETLFSPIDFPKVTQHKWFFNKKLGYVANNRGLYLHRFIFDNLPKGLQIDHINGNKLDNRRSNLRFCTQSQNNMNQKLSKVNISGFKGIYWRKDKNKWQAQIQINYKVFYLGLFKNKFEAAETYNEAAKQYFGEFARLNII